MKSDIKSAGRLAAVHAARLSADRDARIDDSAWIVALNSMPFAAAGQKFDEGRLLTCHREAWRQAAAKADDPMGRILAERDPIARVRLALAATGKVLAVLEERGSQRRLRAVSCSLLAQAGDVELQRTVVQVVGEAVQDLAARLPGFDAALPGDISVNGSGTFTMGGPEGDNGPSGKKLLLDPHGPRVPIGGTALSGKDFWKPDLAGTLLARRLALAVVRSGAGLTSWTAASNARRPGRATWAWSTARAGAGSAARRPGRRWACGERSDRGQGRWTGDSARPVSNGEPPA